MQKTHAQNDIETRYIQDPIVDSAGKICAEMRLHGGLLDACDSFSRSRPHTPGGRLHWQVQSYC